MAIKTLLTISAVSLTLLVLPSQALAEEQNRPDMDKMRQKLEMMRFDMKKASGDAKMKREEKEKEFRAQIQSIKDDRKKKIVERLENKLSSMSARRQEHLLKTHERLTEVYNKLVTKEQTLKAAGHDTASAAAALAEAQEALTTAKEKISSQSGTPYTIDLTDEKNLGQGVKKLVRQVQTDIKADHALLKDAKDALRKAARALAKIEGVNKLKKGATNGPTPTI